MRLLDPRFKYIASTKTDVAATWKRFGFRPTTESERRARQFRTDAQSEKAGMPAPPARRCGEPALGLAATD
jgi:hypothetical protein